jgi:hypothetical protein
MRRKALGASSALLYSGYWGREGPELLDHRLALYRTQQPMVFGVKTYQAFARMLASSMLQVTVTSVS